MLASIRPTQLAEWMALNDIDPFGDERADMRTALQTMQLAQVQGAKRPGGGYFELSDFMLDFRPKATKLLAKAKAVFLGLAAKKKG